MSDTILSGDFTVHYDAQNGRKQIAWSGSSTGTRTLNELYSALQDLFDEPAQMDDLVPILASTPDIYSVIAQWFIDDETVEHLTGGSLFSNGWLDGTDEHVLQIGYAQTTEFSVADIGRNIVGVTSGDEGTLLDFNTDRNLLWIRPDDPVVTTGDEFNNGAEVYRIGSAANGDPVGDATQEDNDGGPLFTSQTTAANEATANDVICYPATSASNDAFYIGFEQIFSKLVIDRLGGTQGVGGVTAYEYSLGGGAWGTLAGVSDATATGGGFGNAAVADADEITFTVPTDWAPDSVGGGASLFYVRFRVTTIYSTEPQLDQCFVSGVGAGAFASHNRHGVGSAAGESAWAGITTIAAIEPNTHVYISQEDPDQISQENLVVATKGSADWWNDGTIDILLKVKESASVFGALPGSSPVTAVATAFARQYTKSYSHFIITNLATAGGIAVVPLTTADDLDNLSGVRNQIWDNGTSESLVDEELLYVVGNLDAGNLDAGVSFEDPATFVDDTTDLNDTGGADVPIFPTPETTNDAFYFGKDNIFEFLMADIATPGVSSAAASVWEYWDGSAWQTLTTVDDSDSGNGAFTAAAGRHLTSWTAPADWARTTVTNQPAAAPVNLYYIRVRVTAENYSTSPVLDVAFVAGELQLKARVADVAIVTAGGATGNADYYILGDPLVDLADDDVIIAATSRKTFDVNGGPSNVGPALDTDITAAHAAISVDITETGANPFSIDINNASQKAVSEIYERFKFLTRRGETATASTDGQEGQFYIGSELQIEYDTQAVGNFAEGSKVYDQTSEAEGVIVADHDDGATGDLILRSVRGTFVAGNVLSDSPDPSQVMNTDSFCFHVIASGPTLADQSADALDAGVGDVLIMDASESTTDYFVVAAAKPFSRVVFDNTGGVQGAGGTGIWEYWNGTAWTTLESAPDFADGTADFTNVVGVVNLDFAPPVDWQPKGEGDGTFDTVGPLFMIRNRITGVYGTNPTYDTVAVEDRTTANIVSVRAIAPVVAAPFGTFPGASKLFFAPGAAPLPAEMAAADVQAFSTIDDDGVTRVPPNKQSVTIQTLVSGDSVAVFRRTGAAVTKTQFTLAAGNVQGAVTLVMDGAIPTDNPNIANSKVRVVSASGDEHRYRITSFTASTYTLATGVVAGTSDGGSSSVSVLHDTTGSPFTDAEVGDYIRNTTQGIIVRIIAVTDANTVTTDTLPLTWSGDSYDYNVLMENYGLDNAYAPIIERIADASEESNTITFTSPINVLVEVRNAGVILPFSQQQQIISTGLTTGAVRNADTIFV